MNEIYDFGIVLKQLRKKRCMTQTDLGNRLGLTKAAVSKYESGVATPPLETLRSMAALFNISLDYLCGTEQRGKISVYNLSGSQIKLVEEITAALREKNQNSSALDEAECFRLIGHLASELTK